MKIRKDDNVVILTGKDRGKSGKILQMLPKDRKVVVQGANMMKRHQRPRRQGEKGQIVSKESPLDVSSVMVICPKCAKPTRVGYRTDGAEKERVCKKCHATI